MGHSSRARSLSAARPMRNRATDGRWTSWNRPSSDFGSSTRAGHTPGRVPASGRTVADERGAGPAGGAGGAGGTGAAAGRRGRGGCRRRHRDECDLERRSLGGRTEREPRSPVTWISEMRSPLRNVPLRLAASRTIQPPGTASTRTCRRETVDRRLRHRRPVPADRDGRLGRPFHSSSADVDGWHWCFRPWHAGMIAVCLPTRPCHNRLVSGVRAAGGHRL